MAQSSKFSRLVSYLKPHWKPVSIGLLSLLIVNAIGVTIPLIIGYIVDELSVSFSFNRLALYVVLVLVLASVMWVIRMVSRIALFGAGRQVEFDLKQRIFDHLLTLEPAYFGRNTIGDLISRSTSDVDNIRRLLGFAILSMANTPVCLPDDCADDGQFRWRCGALFTGGLSADVCGRRCIWQPFCVGSS